MVFILTDSVRYIAIYLYLWHLYKISDDAKMKSADVMNVLQRQIIFRRSYIISYHIC